MAFVVDVGQCDKAVIQYFLVTDLADCKMLGPKYEPEAERRSIIGQYRSKAINAAARVGWLNGLLFRCEEECLWEKIERVDLTAEEEDQVIYSDGTSGPLSDLDTDSGELVMPLDDSPLKGDRATARTLMIKAGLIDPKRAAS